MAITFSAPAQERPVPKVDAAQVQELSARMNTLTSKGWEDGFYFGKELAELPSPVGYMILRNNWNKGSSIESRKQMFKGFVFDSHPDTLLVLNLGMRDPDPSMQAWAMDYLNDIAFQSFADDYKAYLDWFNKYKSMPYAEVKRKSLTEALDKVLAMPDDGLDAFVAGLEPGTRTVSLEDYPKITQIIDRLIARPVLSDGSVEMLARLLKVKSVTPSYRTGVLDKLAASYEPQSNVLICLARAHEPGTFERLLPLATAASTSSTVETLGLYDGLIRTGDPRALPAAIGLLDKANEDQTMRITDALGNYLGFREAHREPAWWKAWWQRNEARYRPPSESDLPSFKIDEVPTAQYIPDADDVKQIPSQSFFVADDPKKRYLLSGTVKPEKTQNVLIVMPGGDGSADFHPFVKRIYMNALGEDWVLAQPIAPNWDNSPDRVVWPSVGSPYPAAKFTMEEFLDGMLDELHTREKVKLGKVFMLGWSSGGPAVYSYLAHGKHPVEGVPRDVDLQAGAFWGDQDAQRQEGLCPALARRQCGSY